MSATTYNEQLQHIADEYISETGQERFQTIDLAVWAVRTGRWEPPTDLIIRKCREDFSRALREEQITDELGRPVRAKHAARIKEGDRQLTLWADIRVAKRSHMEIAFQQRREQIVGDCRQLSNDVEFYNRRHPDEKWIQLTFDFTDDVEEGKFSEKYPNRKQS